MTTTITDGTTIITPTVVDGYRAVRPIRNIIHEIPGRAEPDVTLRPPLLRQGTLRLLFTTEEDAHGAAELHNTSTATFTLASTDLTTIGMTYVPASGEIRVGKESGYWSVEIPYQEIGS